MLASPFIAAGSPPPEEAAHAEETAMEGQLRAMAPPRLSSLSRPYGRCSQQVPA